MSDEKSIPPATSRRQPSLVASNSSSERSMTGSSAVQSLDTPPSSVCSLSKPCASNGFVGVGYSCQTSGSFGLERQALGNYKMSRGIRKVNGSTVELPSEDDAGKLLEQLKSVRQQAYKHLENGAPVQAEQQLEKFLGSIYPDTFRPFRLFITNSLSSLQPANITLDGGEIHRDGESSTSKGESHAALDSRACAASVAPAMPRQIPNEEGSTCTLRPQKLQKGKQPVTPQFSEKIQLVCQEVSNVFEALVVVYNSSAMHFLTPNNALRSVDVVGSCTGASKTSHKPLRKEQTPSSNSEFHYSSVTPSTSWHSPLSVENVISSTQCKKKHTCPEGGIGETSRKSMCHESLEKLSRAQRLLSSSNPYLMLPVPRRESLLALTLHNLGCVFKTLDKYHASLQYLRAALALETRSVQNSTGYLEPCSPRNAHDTNQAPVTPAALPQTKLNPLLPLNGPSCETAALCPSSATHVCKKCPSLLGSPYRRPSGFRASANNGRKGQSPGRSKCIQRGSKNHRTSLQLAPTHQSHCVRSSEDTTRENTYPAASHGVRKSNGTTTSDNAPKPQQTPRQSQVSVDNFCQPDAPCSAAEVHPTERTPRSAMCFPSTGDRGSTNGFESDKRLSLATTYLSITAVLSKLGQHCSAKQSAKQAIDILTLKSWIMIDDRSTMSGHRRGYRKKGRLIEAKKITTPTETGNRSPSSDTTDENEATCTEPGSKQNDSVSGAVEDMQCDETGEVSLAKEGNFGQRTDNDASNGVMENSHRSLLHLAYYSYGVECESLTQHHLAHRAYRMCNAQNIVEKLSQ
eukprot:GHVQ01038385.1.p1 GENE.GHVQ01038385.1~~GHVQ01038385.1.p1  ORF type:complete len:801 (+),score=77.65 GHVQ01038385.1:368-2770(+)